MAEIKIDKRFKRRCSVPGCKCVDTYRVRYVAGYSEQLFLCDKCIEGISNAVKAFNASAEEEKKAEQSDEIASVTPEAKEIKTASVPKKASGKNGKA